MTFTLPFRSYFLDFIQYSFLKGQLIGIGGISRAGKSTLARLLDDHLVSEHKETLVVAQDMYVLPITEIPRIKDKVDWEHPNSIYWSSLIHHLQYAIYHYEVVIFEGLFCFYHPEINRMLDHRIFVEISRMKFINRKKADLRWGSAPEPDWYIDHIWESYLRYGRPSLTSDYIICNGSRYFNIEELSKKIS